MSVPPPALPPAPPLEQDREVGPVPSAAVGALPAGAGGALPAVAARGPARRGRRARARVGLVLGGGGSVGPGYHNGVLAALQDATGFDATTASIIVGTSSGSTTAALVRAGSTGWDLAARACGASGEAAAPRRRARPRPAWPPPPPLRLGLPTSPRALLEAARRPGPVRVGALAAALLPTGPIPTVAAGGPLDRLFPRGWPEAQLWIAAVRLDDGARVLFGRPGDPDTDVATAVAASCALPGWFEPVEVDRRRYIDGAVWSATNADVLVGQGLDLVIVSAPLSAGTSWLHRLQRRYLRQEVRALRRAGTPVVVVEPSLRDALAMGADLMDRARRDVVTRRVRAGTAARLRNGDLAEARELVRRT